MLLFNKPPFVWNTPGSSIILRANVDPVDVRWETPQAQDTQDSSVLMMLFMFRRGHISEEPLTPLGRTSALHTRGNCITCRALAGFAAAPAAGRPDLIFPVQSMTPGLKGALRRCYG